VRRLNAELIRTELHQKQEEKMAQNLDTTTLAKLLDITPRHVRNLTNSGVLSRARDTEGNEIQGRYNLLSVRDYCRYLRSISKLDDASQSHYSVLRNQRLKNEVEMSDLRLKQYKGQLHHASDVEFVMTNMLTFFKQRVLAVPARIGRLLVGKKKFTEIYDILMTEITGCLRELSGYDRQMFAQRNAARLAEEGVDFASLNGKENNSEEASGYTGESEAESE
jgi:hypothetical protein